MIADRSISRKAGDDRIVTQAQSQVQSFFDELKNGTQNYRTIASLGGQIAQEYRGRCILELLQNAHDALSNVEYDAPQQISFVLSTSPEPVLLVGNSGHPFCIRDFKGICQLGQSPKDPNKSVGNKGLGFRSVLEVSTCPEIWSIAPPGSDRSFVFRFDPSVSDRVAASAREIEEQGLDARSPFDPKSPLLDWSQEQLNQYRERLSDTNLDGAHEAKNFLSPYLFPLQIEGVLPEVEKLLSEGYSTVVRLRLDGGRVGSSEGAVQSVKDQLQELDARSMVFLSHLEKLVIDIDDERRTLERIVHSDIELSGCQRTRQQRLLVGCSGPAPEDNITRQFQVWTRIIGGDEDLDQAERIRDAVEHLPNRWPEVRRVTVGIAVEEAPEPEEGAFVIFLPTEMTTGTGAHINAPFYGSLNRRRIDFDDSYNELLLESVLDLCLDAVSELISEEPEAWRARAVIDLLSSTAMVGGSTWRLMDQLHERAAEQDCTLENRALVLCDDGWHVPGEARMMPDISDHNLIGAERWREHAEFAVVSTVLDGRQAAVEALLTKLDGLPSPTHCEWRRTIEHVATNVQARKIDVSWDGFLNSVIVVLPTDLRDARPGTPDPLADMKFLPTQDGRLLSASDPAKLFFQPVRGVDDAADLVEEVPDSLKQRVAFLHPDIRTQEEPQRRTIVQSFLNGLNGRFARGFRREELLRDIVLAALPQLPVPHDSPDADRCSELFSWALMLVGKDESDTLLPLLKRLPVACHGGWFAMSEATFGPGWSNRLGDLVWSFADELPKDAAIQLRKTVLLPPDDLRWRVAVGDRDKLFDRVGVFDGLRLQNVPKVCFHMSNNSYELPADSPTGTPQAAWDDWRNSVHEQVEPWYTSWHEYTLSGIQLLPEIHDIETLSQSGRHSLSRLVLASLGSWPDGWESATIRKLEGYDWSRQIKSPLCYWLETTAWLKDGTAVEQTLSNRWLVPPLLQSQRDRFRHLDPLSVDLAHKLEEEPKLKEVFIRLGLNVYPTEQGHRTGPELLEALATAWTANRVSTGFDVFLGQVRDAWKHLDPDKGLPKTFLVRTGRRTFSTRGSDELTDVYLPDNRDRTRSLQEHGKQILEMEPREATSKADVLSVTSIRRASNLKERFLIDGMPWTGEVNGIPTLNETGYAAWLPITLLTAAAHGGTNPTGATTKTWREAADRLRATHILECEEISGELVDEDQVVASNEPKAQWLPSNVLAIRRDVELSYEYLAPAAQAMLDRQDLLKDLRLVLGALAGQNPTSERIEVAMERAEIDAQALADIRHQWAGNISLLVDRIRPVLELLGVLTDELDAVSTDIECLTEWLSSNLQQWSAPDLLSAARRSPDDRAMGEAAWCALGDVAQLPAWNKVLAALGDRYVTVENHRVDEQTQAHLEEAMPLLRGLARYVAIDTGNPDLFSKIEAESQSFERDNDWSTRWWDVPFGVVIDKLHTKYAEISGAECHLGVLEGVKTVDDLRTAFQTRGIETDHDPYEIAGRNKKWLDEMLLSTHDLRRTWVEFNTPNSIAPEPPEPPVELDPVGYLHQWSDAELLERALRIIDDDEFIKACDGCTNLDDIRQRLKLTPENIRAHRQERLRRDQKEKRRHRTFDVAGAPFEVGMESYGDLFERLKSLTDPEGPNANRDEFTSLAEAGPSGGGSGGGGGKRVNISRLRPSAELRELVGVVGEIHAYRFLRTKFGNDVVTRDAWLSEIRLQVLPPVKGEPDNTSDSHGFDFQFTHRRKKWHVEVKATLGDDPQFDLGISEINEATRLARARGGLWRILRVRNALSDQPEFDWLPNPFEEGSSKLFWLHKGGMKVSYTRKKT